MKKINPQHGFHWHRRTAITCFGIVRFNELQQSRPGNDSFHLIQEGFPLGGDFLCVYAIDANVICFIAKLCFLGVCLLLHNFGGLNQRFLKGTVDTFVESFAKGKEHLLPKLARAINA